ncbi:Melibiose operon regulatory protein [compost metagenome]
MNIRSIKDKIILFPGEIEKWYLQKFDYLVLFSNGNGEISYSRQLINLFNTSGILLHCHQTTISIANKSTTPITLQGVLISCQIQLPKNFIVTNIDLSPFQKLLTVGSLSKAIELDIIDLLTGFMPVKKGHTAEFHNRIDPRLIKVNRYIRNNYCREITLQDLADHVGVHPTYLSNTYSKVFKTSPIYYLNQMRINRAENLLTYSNLSINSIAKAVGYNSHSQFTSMFKRFKDISPSQFRAIEKTATNNINI